MKNLFIIASLVVFSISFANATDEPNTSKSAKEDFKKAWTQTKETSKKAWKKSKEAGADIVSVFDEDMIKVS